MAQTALFERVHVCFGYGSLVFLGRKDVLKETLQPVGCIFRQTRSPWRETPACKRSYKSPDLAILSACPCTAGFDWFHIQSAIFISSVLNTIAHANEAGTRNDSYGLIGAAILIYTGMAMSRAFYGYLSQRLACMVRGCLASAVYDKTTESQPAAGNDAAAVTLMSTDIERVMRAIESFHEVWANTLEAALGCWLL